MKLNLITLLRLDYINTVSGCCCCCCSVALSYVQWRSVADNTGKAFRNTNLN